MRIGIPSDDQTALAAMRDQLNETDRKTVTAGAGVEVLTEQVQRHPIAAATIVSITGNVSPNNTWTPLYWDNLAFDTHGALAGYRYTVADGWAGYYAVSAKVHLELGGYGGDRRAGRLARGEVGPAGAIAIDRTTVVLAPASGLTVVIPRTLVYLDPTDWVEVQWLQNSGGNAPAYGPLCAFEVEWTRP
jgi:hypothetical protein